MSLYYYALISNKHMIITEIKYLIKHSTIYSIGTVVGQLVGFLLLPLYTRFLTPTDYGILSLIEISIGLIGIVVGFGITEAMSRFYFDYIEEADRNRVVSISYWLTSIFAIISLPLCLSASPFISLILFHSKNFQQYSLFHRHQ